MTYSTGWLGGKNHDVFEIVVALLEYSWQRNPAYMTFRRARLRNHGPFLWETSFKAEGRVRHTDSRTCLLRFTRKGKLQSQINNETCEGSWLAPMKWSVTFSLYTMHATPISCANAPKKFSRSPQSKRVERNRRRMLLTTEPWRARRNFP